MSKLKTLEDLFEHQLKDLHSAESQQMPLYPKLIEATNNKKLKKAIKDQHEQTQSQLKRLEKIGDKIGKKLTGHKCKAMEGLVKEASGFLEEKTSPEVLDAGIIAELQRIEHYEISGYGTARRYAQQLDQHDIAEQLGKTLEEEGDADEALNDLAIEVINEKAEA